jgi:2-keto-3-deoxy-L-rhamnonate aldolase RhmA
MCGAQTAAGAAEAQAWGLRGGYERRDNRAYFWEEIAMSELRSILRNHMKEKLARNEVVASMTVRLCRTIEIAQIARTAGFDTLYVDMEHNTLTVGETCQICIAAQQIGITPLVRVPANSPEYICRVLDGGAMGVITPHVRSATEAREIVKLVKFAPLGERSAGGALSQYQYRSFPLAETNAAMNDATSLVLMMETVAALENVDEIMAVDGVDMMMIGSNDLCNEMGITGQFDSPKLRDAFERTIAAAQKHGKHVGVGGLASRNDLMTQFVGMGARYVSTGTDMAFLMAECARKAKFVGDIGTPR